jgi:NAD(P)-dependent dehydrogenase (short-subunit alcohol dehydrogenase family)
MSNLVASLFARPAFEQHKVPDLSDRVYVVTGGSNGIGLSASRTLFTHGAKVIILSSQASIGAEAEAYIKSGKLEDAPQAYREGFGAQTDKFVFFFPLLQAFSDLFSSFYPFRPSLTPHYRAIAVLPLTLTSSSANGATKDGSIEHKVVDLGDLKAVATLAKDLASLPRLDGFLGIAGLGVKDFELTADGFECVFPFHLASSLPFL